MSQAFVREGDDQSLEDIGPSINSLVVFLTRQNNGVRVYEKRNYVLGERHVYVMSDGLSYEKDAHGKWKIVQ
jgi:hypothetical protein